ncbi:MAG: F0F1 ATP synthase subunit A [bacterium]|nr:F0F1 ATP synthase subunit A [bacterium]
MSNLNPTLRGLVYLGIGIAFLVVCAGLSFAVLPGAGIGVGLPVITVPGEALGGALPADEDYGLGGGLAGWTNTFVAMILADIMVLAFAFLVRRSSKNFTRQVPSRLQSWAELLGGFIYSQTKNFAGLRPLALNWLFPLAATIFVFLLAVNWMKLLPGIESVGVIHCAHEGFTGYPTRYSGGSYSLYVDQALYAGERATEETYHACEEWKEAGSVKPSKEALDEAANTLAANEAALIAEIDTLALNDAERQARIDAVRLEAVEEVWEHPFFPLTADELRSGVIPYIMAVTPYVRGGSTDLNLTLGLALVAFFAIQIFGVAAQGPAYFQKFINLDAIGNAGKNPIGAINFLVGIFEIVSEIGKIISLAFRLFGNMFAGGILLAVMSLLVAFILPAVFIGLEVIITSVQAMVFAILTIVFCAQAMEGHHGEEHHDDEHDQPVSNVTI